MEDLIRETRKEAPRLSPIRLTFLGYLILGAFLGIILMLMSQTHQEQHPAAAVPTVETKATPPADWPDKPTPVPAPRAQLMPIPMSSVPRAQLVHVRPIGSVENDGMPDGRVLTTRYMGELSGASSLPTRGANLGDMWFTQNDGHCWVLAPIPGSSTVGWIDP